MPALVDPDTTQRLGHCWALNRADMADRIFWVRQYQREGQADKASKVAQQYLSSLRLAMEAEVKMIELGIEFIRTELA